MKNRTMKTILIIAVCTFVCFMVTLMIVIINYYIGNTLIDNDPEKTVGSLRIWFK